MKCFMMFPGQGSQFEGMLSEVSAEDKQLVERLTGIHMTDTNEQYRSTIGIQLGLLLKQVFEARKILTEGFTPSNVAGHSIGSFSAAVIAGSLSFEDAIKLVHLRSRLMAEDYPDNYGMAAVVGLLKNELVPIVEAATTSDEPVYLSNENAPQQFTISGHINALNRVIKSASQSGASKAILLAVPTPSHCPLMSGVRDALALALEQVTIRDPNCLYFMNHTGLGTNLAKDVKKDLIEGVASPVKWDIMSKIALENRMDLAVDIGPGETLTKLIQAQDDSLKVINVSKLGVDDALYVLNKERKKY